MAKIRIALSIDETLLKEVNALAREMNIRRSHLFAKAMGEFLERRRNRELLEKINQAYADEPDPAEREYRTQVRSRHRKLVQGQW